MRYRMILLTLSALLMLGTGNARADKYAIDTKMGHAFVNFKFRHLGYSILAGTFEKFSGEFDWDPEDVTASSVSVEIETKSLNSNHAERDRHIREEKYLDTDRFPRAVFRSTRVDASGDGGMIIHGDLTLRGITREISIAASPIAAGNDPWGGYRAGFEGYVTLDMREFGVSTFVPGHTVDMELFVEGVRQ